MSEEGDAPSLCGLCAERKSYPPLFAVRSRLEALRTQLEEAMRAAKVSSKVKSWVQASCYDLYDMMSLVADEEGGGARGSSPKSQGLDSEREAEGLEDGQRQVGGGSDRPVLDTERLAWCTRILKQVGRRMVKEEGSIEHRACHRWPAAPTLTHI